MCLAAQSCLILYDPVDYSSPAPLSMGIFQEGILEWVAISFSNLLGYQPDLRSHETDSSM